MHSATVTYTGNDEAMSLKDTPITYPRWISHISKDSIYVQSEEDAQGHYAEGYSPWPIEVKLLPVDIIKAKVRDLEDQIQVLIGSLSDEDAKLVMQDVYGDTSVDTTSIEEGATATDAPEESTSPTGEDEKPVVAQDAPTPRARRKGKKT